MQPVWGGGGVLVRDGSWPCWVCSLEERQIVVAMEESSPACMADVEGQE